MSYTYLLAGLWSVHHGICIFQKINMIGETNIIDPAFILTWLCSTALLYILYMVLFLVAIGISSRRIKKQNDDAELGKMRLRKGLSFIWSGPFEEAKILSHILGLIVASAVLVYCPFLSFVRSKANLVILTIIYGILTILVAWLFLRQFITCSKYMISFQKITSKNYCDIANEKTYIHERACFFAKIRNDEFQTNLNQSNQVT